MEVGNIESTALDSCTSPERGGTGPGMDDRQRYFDSPLPRLF
jgi:hypothetical protein